MEDDSLNYAALQFGNGNKWDSVIFKMSGLALTNKFTDHFLVGRRQTKKWGLQMQ